MFKHFIATLLLTSSTMLFAMSISEVNSATKEELMKINGIGDKKASAIIKERKKGKFKSFDDLKQVSGIGDKMVSNIKNDVKSKTTKKSSTKTSSSKKSSTKSTKDTSKTKKSTSSKDKTSTK